MVARNHVASFFVHQGIFLSKFFLTQDALVLGVT
jgi:hypothetical protein